MAKKSFLLKLGEKFSAGVQKVADSKAGKVLDFVSQQARNPLAILNPKAAAKKGKQIRESIEQGTPKAAAKYITGVVTQTAINAAAVLGGASATGAKLLTAKNLAIAAPIVGAAVASPAVREFVSTKGNLGELGFFGGEQAEKIIDKERQKNILKDDELIIDNVPNILKDIAGVGVGAGVGAGSVLAYDFFKEKENSLSQPSGQLMPSADYLGTSTPITPQTEKISTKSPTTKRKRRATKKTQIMPNINIKIDNRDDWDSCHKKRKVYKGGYC